MMPMLTRNRMAPIRQRFGDKWYVNIILNGLQWLSARQSLYKHLQARGVATVVWVLNCEERLRCSAQTGSRYDHD